MKKIKVKFWIEVKNKPLTEEELDIEVSETATNEEINNEIVHRYGVWISENINAGWGIKEN